MSSVVPNNKVIWRLKKTFKYDEKTFDLFGILVLPFWDLRVVIYLLLLLWSGFCCDLWGILLVLGLPSLVILLIVFFLLGVLYRSYCSSLTIIIACFSYFLICHLFQRFFIFLFIAFFDCFCSCFVTGLTSLRLKLMPFNTSPILLIFISWFLTTFWKFCHLWFQRLGCWRRWSVLCPFCLLVVCNPSDLKLLSALLFSLKIFTCYIYLWDIKGKRSWFSSTYVLILTYVFVSLFLAVPFIQKKIFLESFFWLVSSVSGVKLRKLIFRILACFFCFSPINSGECNAHFCVNPLKGKPSTSLRFF